MYEEWSPGHLPNLLDFDSMIDALTLCNFCILSNVLDFRTYGFPGVGEDDRPTERNLGQRRRWDRNALTVQDRQYFTYVRGLAINFIQWLSCSFDAISSITKQSVKSFQENICGKYLMTQACAILQYKEQAVEQKLPTIPWCSYSDVEQQIEFVFQDDENQNEPWFGDWTTTKFHYQDHSSLQFLDPTYQISRKKEPLPFNGKLLILCLHFIF